MLKTFFGFKKDMSQTYVGDTRVPVTVVDSKACVVTAVKTKEKDGYWGVQLGVGEKKLKNVKNPQKGHLEKTSKTMAWAPRYFREIKLEANPEVKVGDKIMVTDIFKKGDMVTVSGTSKGKGFAGVVKRWHFAGGPRTHGQSDRLRAPGSIGQGTTPGRVLKGKHMAGRMGNARVTIKNLIVTMVDPENALLELSGPVPGVRNGLLEIKKTASGKLQELIEETPQVVVQEEAQEVQKEETNNQEESKGGVENE